MPPSRLKKLNEPGKARACHCLRMAFNAAEQSGDRETAMMWWEEAIKAGYIPSGKTKSQLLFKLRLAEEKNAAPMTD